MFLCFSLISTIWGFKPFRIQTEVTNFGKPIFPDFFFLFCKFHSKANVKLKQKLKSASKLGFNTSSYVCFCFFVKNDNFDQFDQFWKNHKFQKFANFRIKKKIVPNVDYVGLVIKKTLPSIIFHWEKIRFTLVLLINGQNCLKIRNFPENSKKCRSP